LAPEGRTQGKKRKQYWFHGFLSTAIRSVTLGNFCCRLPKCTAAAANSILPPGNRRVNGSTEPENELLR
jgi:hypothetical protein